MMLRSDCSGGNPKLYIERDAAEYPELRAMIGGSINVRQITDHWDEILRLATSIRTGSVTASLMVRKISSYPLSPLGWDHINLTGDYVWPRSSRAKPNEFRPLRTGRGP